MVIAEIGSTPYNIMLLLHIGSAFVAFAPAFVWPFVSVRLKKAGEPVGPTINRLAAGNTLKIHGPAYVITGFLGFGLAGMSDEVFRVRQTWLSIAALLWFVGMGIMFGLMHPAEKKAASGDAAAEKQLSMYGGILHLILFVSLYLMVWKPGF
jgi:uncharacterized membrane protein